MNPTATPGTVFSTPSDREVAWTRSFAAPRERVFRAFTEPEHVQRWMLGPDGWTMPVCEIDLRVGGAWRCVWRNADGDEYVPATVNTLEQAGYTRSSWSKAPSTTSSR